MFSTIFKDELKKKLFKIIYLNKIMFFTIKLKIAHQKIYANSTHFVGEPKIVTNVVFTINPVQFYVVDVT